MADESTRKRQHYGGDESGALPPHKRSGQDNDTPMIKMLVPHRHAGALIGKGGENMKRLETDSGARIKLSQSSEFYPETGERVLSARGDVNQVQCAVEMVLQSLEASGRGNQEEGAEMPAQQVRLIIPERAAGSLIGKGGENIRRLQEDSSSRVSVSGKDATSQMLNERLVTIFDSLRPFPYAGVSAVLNYLLTDGAENMQYTNWTTSYARMPTEQMNPMAAAGNGMFYGMMQNPYGGMAPQAPLLGQPYGGAPMGVTHGGAPMGVAHGVPHHGVAHPGVAHHGVAHGVEPLTIPCPDACVGAVVGRRGDNIREMMRRSGAQIKVSQKDEFLPNTRDRFVTVTGVPHAQQMAAELVYERIREAQSRPQTGF